MSAPAPDPGAALGEIRGLIEAGRHGDAATRCRALAEHFTDRPDVLTAAGTAALHARDARTAVACLRRAVGLAPQAPPAQAGLGLVLAAVGQLREAQAAYARAIELGARDLETVFAHAVVLERLGRAAEAEAGYRRCLELRPGLAPALLGVGNALRGQGRLEAACAAYREASAADPELVSAYNNLGGVLQELEDYPAAEHAYHEVVARAPAHADAWYNLGVCRRRMRRFDNAAEAMREAAAASPRDPRILMNLGIAFQDVDALDDALTAYRDALGCVRPDEPYRVDLLGKLHSRIADVHVQRGDLDAALAACDEYLGQRRGDSSLLAAKAVVLNERGDEAALAEILDWENLVRPMRFETPPGYPGMDAFNRALAEHVLAHPSLQYAPQDHATRNGMHSGDLLAEPKGPIADLERALWASLAEHERRIAEAVPDHPFLTYRPKTLALRMWGVVMHTQGHQIPHIHPASWVSGCYYPRIPDFVARARDSQAGWIEFARTPEWFHFRREMPARAFPPEEGALFLFPGYLWHRTVPFEEQAERISVAFDFVPGQPEAA